MIKQSNTTKFETGRNGYLEYGWYCTCQRCGKQARAGRTPGDAADEARAAGFLTVPAKRLTDPASWFCTKGCAEGFISDSAST